MDFQHRDEGWLTTIVGNEIIKRAKQIRAERDQQYGNVYQEEESDERWVGEVGEICFNEWLNKSHIQDSEWILDDAAGRPDFKIGRVSVGMKTVKRQVPFQSHYTAQVTAKHVEEEPVDQFFFASFEAPKNRLWMIGGIERDEFRKEAQYYGPGEQVHPNYTVRPGHEIYNIEQRHLRVPTDWIENL